MTVTATVGLESL